MNDKIIVTNTAIIINNYEPGDCVKLENNFKIFDPIVHSYYYMGMYYDNKNKKLYLPRGIDIWYVENILNEPATVLTNTYDIYHRYDNVSIRYLPRDDVQKQALRFMLGKGEYLKNKYKSQLAVNLGTGKGKTYLTIATLAYLCIRGIIITSTVGWLEQWRDRAIEYTDINPKDLYIISGSGNISRLLRSTDEQLSRYKLFMVTHSSIQSYASNNGWEAIGELFRKLKIGIKVFDESHLDFNNICMIDFFTNTYRTYYLTATPGKSNERENQIYQMAFKNVPSIELFNKEIDPHTSYIAIFFNSNPSPGQISDCKSKYGIDRNKYTNYLVKQEYYYKLLSILIDLTNRLVPDPDHKILIYIGTNNAILETYNWMIENYPEFKNSIGIYTSIIDSKEKRKALEKRFILSTTKSAGAALDVPGLMVTISLAEPYKSEIIAKQSLGRTRAENTFYIDCIDVGFDQCRRFYYKKLPTFEKYAKDCSVVRLNKAEMDTRYNNIIMARNSNPITQKQRKSLFTHI